MWVNYLLFTGLSQAITLILLSHLVQNLASGTHEVFSVIVSQHLFLYNILFMTINFVKIFRGVLNFNVFWSYVLDDTRLIKFSYLTELVRTVLLLSRDPSVIPTAILYKMCLIMVTDRLSKRLGIPVMFSWMILRNSINIDLNSVLADVSPGWYLFVFLLLMNIYLQRFFEPRIRVSVSETTSSAGMLSAPWDHGAVRDRLNRVNFESTYVPFHVIYFFNSIKDNLLPEVDMFLAAPVLFVLNFLQVYLECLQVNKFDLILKYQQSTITGKRPGVESRRYLNRYFLKILAINYLRVLVLYQGLVTWPGMIYIYNVFTQYNMLRKLWVVGYLRRHYGSVGRRMNYLELKSFLQIVGAVFSF